MRTSISKFLCLLVFTSFTIFTSAQQVVNALAFDGVDDYVSLGNTSVLKPTTNLTVEAWVYNTNWRNASGYIISNESTQGYSLRLIGGTLFGRAFFSNGFVDISYDCSMLAGWHHIALIFSDDKFTLYLDGNQIAQQSGIIGSIIYDGSNTIIGANTAANSDFINCTIDELKIWGTSIVISPSIIALEENQNATDLLAYYRFNQGDANGVNAGTTTLNDLTNGSSGTLHNFSLNGASSNWVEGKALNAFGQSSSLAFSQQLGDSFTISWTRAGSNEGGNAVKVFVAELAGSGRLTPVDGTNYGAGSELGTGDAFYDAATGMTWYCVYDGPDNSVNVTGLSGTAETYYAVQVIEYQFTSSELIFSSAVTSNNSDYTENINGFFTPISQITALTTTYTGTNTMSVSWTPYDGANTIVFVCQASSGSYSPVDLTNYTPNSNFGSGTPVGSNWYCVSNTDNQTNLVTVSNLTPGLSYRVIAYSYFGYSGLERYNTSLIENTNARTYFQNYPEPTTQASAITFSNQTTTSATVNFTAGNGTNRIAFLRQITTGTFSPSDNTTYTVGSFYSLWRCVYIGNGNSFDVTGLTAKAQYRVRICEYNGTSTHENYNVSSSVTNPVNFSADYQIPGTQASYLNFPDVSGTSITASWTSGNGTSRIVFARIDNGPLNAVPSDGTTYGANSSFMGTGSSQIGITGWYCVYKGSSNNNVTITGLTAGTTYRIMVCDYNGTPTNEKYNKSYNNTPTVEGNNKSVTTNYLVPSSQALNVHYSNVTQNSFRAAWVRGNGSTCAAFIKQTESTSELANPADYNGYTANAVAPFGNQIGSSGWYCIYNGTDTFIDVSNLNINSNYRVMVCEYNGGSNQQRYNRSSSNNNPANQLTNATSPTLQATNVAFVDDLNYPLSSTALHISWTNGNGSNRVVFMKQGNSGTVTVPDGATGYTANPAFMGQNSSQIGEWYCVFNGSGNNVTVTGLTNTTNYQVQVFEYYYYLGEYRYNTSSSTGNPATGTTDFVSPVGQASGLSVSSITPTGFTVNWVNADPSAGTNVFIANVTTGNPAPVNNTTYNIDATLATNWRAVYRGTGTSTTVSGLTPGQSYKLIAFAYNGTAGKEKYNSSTAANNPLDNNTTLSATTWNGSAWNYGTPDATLDAVIDGNGCPANFIAKNLTIISGRTFNIPAGQSVTVNGNLLNNGRIYLRSPNSMGAAGSLITNGAITSNDSVFAERYITAGTTDVGNKTWHFLGSPVTTAFEVSKTFALDYVASYTHPNFIALKKGEDFNPRIGYRVKTVAASGSKILLFGGTSFNTGSQTFTINGTMDAFTLISNPYPSAIDWNAASGLTRTNVYNYTWIWNPNQNVYAVWNGSSGTNGASSIIPAMQGFYVCTSGASPALEMNNNVRVHSTTSTMSDNASDLIRLSVSGNGSKDEVLFHNLPIENVGYKMFSPVGYVPQLSVYQNDKEFSMLGIDANIRDTLIYLGFTCEEKGEFEFKLDKFNLNTNQYLYIIDSKTGLASKISESSSYKFNYEPGDNKTRFKLLVGTDTEIVNSVLDKQINIADIWSYDNKVVVNLKLEGRNTIRIFNLQGVEVMNSLQQNSKLFQYELEKTGIYVVSVTNNMGTTTKKVFIK